MNSLIYEQDILTLYVKKDKVQQVVQYYKNFGWDIVKQTNNDWFIDLMDLTFARESKIKNKDELQLLQIYMEEKLNTQAKLENYKAPKSFMLGSSVGLLVLFLIIIGIIFITKSSFVLGTIFVFIGISVAIFVMIIIPKLYKIEKLAHDRKIRILSYQIQKICKRAVMLSGDRNEEI